MKTTIKNTDAVTVKEFREGVLDGFPDNWQMAFEDENGNSYIFKSAVNEGQFAVVRLSSQ